MNIEYINDDEFIEIEKDKDYSYYVLMKKVGVTHSCADGYFYDWYKDEYYETQAADYILYYDREGHKFENPICVAMEWRREKDV